MMMMTNVPFLEHCNKLTQSIPLNRQRLTERAEFLALQLQLLVTCPANYRSTVHSSYSSNTPAFICFSASENYS